MSASKENPNPNPFDQDHVRDSLKNFGNLLNGAEKKFGDQIAEVFKVSDELLKMTNPKLKKKSDIAGTQALVSLLDDGRIVIDLGSKEKAEAHYNSYKECL